MIEIFAEEGSPLLTKEEAIAQSRAALSLAGVSLYDDLGLDPENPIRLRSLEAIHRELAEQPRRRWLVERILAAGESAVIVAEKKAGKSMLVADLTVSIATGTPWLGAFPCQMGRVVVFCGEDALREFEQRLAAVCEHRGRGLADLWGGRVFAHDEVPRLASERQVAALLEHVEAIRPLLVVVDPAYLANEGLDMRDLYAMGAALRRLTLGAGRLGAATVFAWHTNRSDRARPIDKATGAGPVEVARTLIGLEVKARRTAGGVEHADLRLERRGSSVPEETWRVSRRMWRDDPSALESPLHYEIEVEDEIQQPEDGLHRGLQRVRGALSADFSTYEEIQDRQSRDGSAYLPHKTDTLKRYLQRLADLGIAEGDGSVGTRPQRWRLVPSEHPTPGIGHA